MGQNLHMQAVRASDRLRQSLANAYFAQYMRFNSDSVMAVSLASMINRKNPPNRHFCLSFRDLSLIHI